MANSRPQKVKTPLEEVDVYKQEDPAEIRLRSVVVMGLGFSAMLRLYAPGAKKKLYRQILPDIRQLLQAKSEDEFVDFHSRVCDWGTENINLRNGETFASYGQIAKTLDVVLKVVIYYCHLPDCEKSSKILGWLNAAVDTKMMGKLRKEYPRAIVPWPHSIQEVNRQSYRAIQELVRRYIIERHPGILPVQFDDIYWWRLNKSRVYSDDSTSY
jgi:hypothetical protein